MSILTISWFWEVPGPEIRILRKISRQNRLEMSGRLQESLKTSVFRARNGLLKWSALYFLVVLVVLVVVLVVLAVVS